MPPVSFTGVPSVIDRTVFTYRGPIVKPPLDLLTGSNLQVVSATDVSILTGNFNSGSVGKLLVISGSAGGRNDGTFVIQTVISPTRLTLANASFDISDVGLTTATIIAVANDLAIKFNLHRTRSGVHGSPDSVNAVSSPPAFDLASAIVLLNDLRVHFNAHTILVSGTPPVHNASDAADSVVAPAAVDFPSALNLARELKIRYETHRLDRLAHVSPDLIDVITAPDATAVTGVFPGALTGPFTWVYRDPQTGTLADDPSDVSVLQNGLPASVDAVFGLIGAVVLSSPPGAGDVISVDYNYLNNPPVNFLRLNDHGMQLNQAGNLATGGFPGHLYRMRSHLIGPKSVPDLMSAVQPQKVGWKYKALERKYTASLNDPETLLLNVPTNRLTYPVLFQEFPEVTIKYDPTSLPQNSTDPWVLEGDGTLTLAPGGNLLTIVDTSTSTGPNSKPPFFTHAVDLRSPSSVSAAFRTQVNSSTNDGAFTGVGFGLSDGERVALVGFILTDAINLSSGIVMANNLRAEFNSHLVTATVHSPNDPDDTIVTVNATDLTSLVILANDILNKYNAHIVKGGISGVHIIPDSVNTISAPVATDLNSALLLINQLRTAFNAHRIQAGVHFTSDFTNVVDQVQQVGILTNRGFEEFQTSWNAGAASWSTLQTYRIFRDSNGTVSVFLSGSFDPLATALHTELPAISNLDGRFDPLQQVFFGALGRESANSSSWQFIRVNLNPVDANLIGDNKLVDYEASVVPELDPVAPWITIGQEGFDRILSPNILSLDSTASAPANIVQALGTSSGVYRGFLRLEPILSTRTTSAVEFNVAADYWTHGLSNTADCVVVDDDLFTIQFCLLQFSPSSAIVNGFTTEPFPIVSGDTIILSIGQSAPVTVTFTGTETTAVQVAARINTFFSFTLASAVLGQIRLTSQDVGSSAKITILSGTALQKLGLSPGQYFGTDSNPEPKISWYGADLPDLDTPQWVAGGLQSAEMLGRVMRISDLSTTDFRAYSLTDQTITNRAIDPAADWKLDVRLRVLTFSATNTVPANPPFLTLKFAGALIVVDEGPSGKNLELHLAVDNSGSQYLNLVSYNSATGALDVMAQYAFAWNDGNFHSFNVYTSKPSNQIFVFADAVQLSPLVIPPTYFGLNSGVTGPSVTFGSGGQPVTGTDMRLALSVVDWDSVAVFRDSKIADPSSGTRRYVGIFKGGDSSLLSSYYLHQIDWSVLHTYRVIRDPVSGVQVYVDGGPTPVISVPYDVLTLPPLSTSFLNGATSGHQCVAFGSFNPSEISRTRWDFIKYSIGKLTLTDRLIPPHNVLNQANAIASPEHLRTTKPHAHFGFKVYSGGTPYDDFMADETVPAFTNLGEGTPPVPMTQDLESRGGFIKVATPVEDIAATDLVNTKGFITDLEDDTYNPLSSPSFLSSLISLSNDLRAKYEAHRSLVPPHQNPDGINFIVAPVAIDLASAVTLLNDLKSKYNSHRIQATVHFANDSVNVVSAANAVDATTASILADALRTAFEAHRVYAGPHIGLDGVNTITVLDAVDIPTLVTLIEAPGGIRSSYNAHRVSAFHPIPDNVNAENMPTAVDTQSAAAFLSDIVSRFNRHLLQAGVHLSPDLVSTIIVPGVISLVGLGNLVKAQFNDHLVLQDPHSAVDQLDAIASAPVSDPLLGSIALANDIRSKYLDHVVQARVHLANDTKNVILPSVATDLSSAIALANAEKAQFNLHLSAIVQESQQVHTNNDLINTVVSADATDLPSLLILLDELHSKYEAHRTQSGVHGSTVFIRLDPPSGVLYESMKFWTISTGEPGHVAPFSDDETWHIDAIRQSTPQTLSLHGGALPEQSQLVGATAEPFSIVGGDNLILQVDGNTSPQVTVAFQVGDTSLANVITRINGTSGLPATLASSNGDGRLRLTSPTIGGASSVQVIGGTAKNKLGLDVPQYTPWTIISDNPAAVSVSLQSSGPTDFVRYGTTGSTKTRYVSNSGLPDTPAGIQVTLRIRINSVYTAVSDFDSNIYVGISGIAGPGYSIGIGFEQLANVKFVKIQDLNAGTTLFRTPFNWLDGAFHTYQLTRNVQTNKFSLTVS